MQNLNVDDMLNPFLIPTNEIDQPTTEKLEVILKDQFGCSFVVNDFTVIEIHNQSAAEFITYLTKNLSNIDGMLINSNQIITLKLYDGL